MKSQDHPATSTQIHYLSKMMQQSLRVSFLELRLIGTSGIQTLASCFWKSLFFFTKVQFWTGGSISDGWVEKPQWKRSRYVLNIYFSGFEPLNVWIALSKSCVTLTPPRGLILELWLRRINQESWWGHTKRREELDLTYKSKNWW